MYSFEAEVLGVKMTVSGEYTPDEPENDFKGGFEVYELEHEGVTLEADGLHADVLKQLELEALEAMVNDAEEAASEAAGDMAYGW